VSLRPGCLTLQKHCQDAERRDTIALSFRGRYNAPALMESIRKPSTDWFDILFDASILLIESSRLFCCATTCNLTDSAPIGALLRLKVLQEEQSSSCSEEEQGFQRAI